MSSLSIMVPRIGDEQAFETTLASVLRFRLPHHQIIAVLGPDQSDPYGLGDEVTFVNCDRSPGLGNSLNAALPLISGDVTHLLRPGIEVFHHWFAPGMRCLQDPSAGMVAVPLVTAENPDRPVSRGLGAGWRMNVRHRRSERGVLAPSSWAAYYRTSLLRGIAPLDPGLGAEFAALDCGLAIQASGGNCARIDPQQALSLDDANRLRVGFSRQAGGDAARLCARHRPGSAGGLRDRLALGGELACGLVHPGRWIRLAGRGLAATRATTDTEFQRRIYETDAALHREGPAHRQPAIRRAA